MSKEREREIAVRRTAIAAAFAIEAVLMITDDEEQDLRGSIRDLAMGYVAQLARLPRLGARFRRRKGSDFAFEGVVVTVFSASNGALWVVGESAEGQCLLIKWDQVEMIYGKPE